jgi:hypothetical protein
MRVLLPLMTLLFSGCVAAPPVVTGPYAARLSSRDIQQIQRVVSARPDIEHRIRALEAKRPDKVYVRTGRGPSADDWSGDGFFVLRSSGGWHIDDRSPVASVARIPPTY